MDSTPGLVVQCPAATAPVADVTQPGDAQPVGAQSVGAQSTRNVRSGRRRLHIAMIGQRGVPATYGGVERHVEELGTRLVDRGHRVTVFCRSNYSELRSETWQGMELRYVPSIPTKHLEAITHSTASVAAAVAMRPDVIHFHALGPGLVSPIARNLGAAAVVQTVHGLDGDRLKWGRLASRILHYGERLSARVPHETIVVSADLARHYSQVHDRDTFVIPNGVAPPEPAGLDALPDRWGLTPGSYVLYVGRIVPEKRVDLLLSVFRELDTDKRLLIAGGDSFSSDYVREVEQLAARDDRVMMLGYVYGARLRALYAHAAAFVAPSALEGQGLTVLEAASFGAPVVASDIPQFQEVIGSSRPGAQMFREGDPRSLAAALEATIAGGPQVRAGAAALRDHVLATYDWDRMTDRVEDVYYRSTAAAALTGATVSGR